MHDIIETSCQLIAKDSAAIKIVQITDTHIIDDGAPSFNNYDTSASLNNVIQEIKLKEADTDLILLTGDLVHEPTDTAYQKLADHLSVITTPLYCLPGNHDDPNKMGYVMGANGFDMSKLIRIGQWLIILLDTHLTGEHAGELKQDELLFLSKTLEANPDSYCLIALHHHPVSINSTWMDAMSLINPEDFFNVIDEHKQIKTVIWGHIHQEFFTERNDVSFYGTPSTCLQFTPESNTFQVDNKSPAYRIIILEKTGAVDTKIKYLS